MRKAKTNMHAEDVKAKVRKTGVSLAQLARDNELSDSAVRKALYEPIPRGNAAIADYLHMALHDLWPEWFDKDGNRISGPKTTRGSRPAASQNRSPALTGGDRALALRKALA